MDTADLVAIDVHTHVHASVRDEGPTERGGQLAGLDHTFGPSERLTVPQLAAYYREREIGCVVFTVDSGRTAGGHERGGRRARGEKTRHHDPVRQHRPGRGAEGGGRRGG